jgi:hypothetical protein
VNEKRIIFQPDYAISATTMNVNLADYSHKYILIIAIWFFSVVMPGFLYLFIFRSDFYFYLGFFSLSMLALAITQPVLLLNTILFLLLYNKLNTDIKMINAIFRGEILCSFVFYASIIIGFLFDLKMSEGIIIILILQLLVCLYFVYKYFKINSILSR